MNRTSTNSGPLVGLTVVDFGHYYAGPLAAMLLADQGARVIRVTQPGSPELPDEQYRVVNRNKTLIELDLKSAQGKARARQLATAADVVIENFRPGVMDRLGLGWASLKAINPSLIYLSLPGFSAADVARREIQAWEGVLCAATSLYRMDMLRDKFNFPPHYMSLAPCSTFGAMHGAVAVLAALHARKSGAAGQLIEAPLAAAGLSTCARSFVFRGEKIRTGDVVLSNKPLPDSMKVMAFDESDSAEISEKKLAGLYQFLPNNFVTHAYRSKDQRLMMFMPIKPEMAQRFFDYLGLTQTLVSEGYKILSPWQSPVPADVKNLANAWELGEHNKSVIDHIQALVGEMTAEECQKVMLEARIPFSYVRTRDEWMNIAALVRAGMFVDMGSDDRVLRAPGRVVDVTGPDGQMALDDSAFREARSLTWEQLTAETDLAPSSRPSAATAREKHQLLAGVKVLDLCNVVAGPNAAYTLAQYGAEVMRVEPPKSFNLPMHLSWTLEVNQGKRSMVLDIKSQAGKAVFDRLVRDADIVLHNRLDDVAAQLGLSETQLKRINPAVIVCQVSAFGASLNNAWEQQPGYDPNPNMTSGLEASRGSVESPSQMMEVLTDLMGGLSLAFGALVALRQRDETGFSGFATGSLARGCNYYQMPQMILGRDEQSTRHSGWFAVGESLGQRMYACADQRWIFVGVRPGDESHLCELVAGGSTASEADLAHAFASKEAQHWCRRLQHADIGCHIVVDIDEICHAEPLAELSNHAATISREATFDVVCHRYHPCGQPLVLPLPSWVRCGDNRHYRKLQPAPKVGQHTRVILQELGYSDAEVEALYQQQVAWDYLPAIGNSEDYFFVQEKVAAETA